MAAAEVDSEIYQIALLIDELKHTELQCRVASMQKLAQIGEYWRDPNPSFTPFSNNCLSHLPTFLLHPPLLTARNF